MEDQPTGGAVIEPSSERRHEPRQPRALKVRFWKHGNAEPYEGVSANLSAGGIFVATPDPQPIGSRVVVRFLEPHVGFVAEAVVIHSEDSGMGIRFLSIEELMAQLLESAEAGSEPAA